MLNFSTFQNKTIICLPQCPQVKYLYTLYAGKCCNKWKFELSKVTKDIRHHLKNHYCDKSLLFFYIQAHPKDFSMIYSFHVHISPSNYSLIYFPVKGQSITPTHHFQGKKISFLYFPTASREVGSNFLHKPHTAAFKQ